MNKLENLIELRLSHIAIDLSHSLQSQFPQLSNIQIVHLSQVTSWPWPNQANEPFIQTQTNVECWQAIAFIFPSVKNVYVRVKRNSIFDIETFLKRYFRLVEKYEVYSVGDKVEHYFGRHFDCYYNIPAKSFRVFESISEILFDFVKDL